MFYQLKHVYLLIFLLVSAVAFSQSKHVVQVSNNVFTPDELVINVGDTVEWRNVEGWHNVNGLQSTYPSNPESFGNNTGSGWVFSHVFNTVGKYDYQCDPHVGFGMIGKIEVKAGGDDENKKMLTVNFSGMNPHDGQKLYLSIINKDDGSEVARMVEDITPQFSVSASVLELNHSYKINFFADHNSNGLYDAPPVDHAWSLDLDNISGDETINFAHNTNFTDIEWMYKLTLKLEKMNPHVGQEFTMYLYDVESSMIIDTISVNEIEKAEFSIASFKIVPGKSYQLKFYSDHNGNGQYDAPPVDHAWQIPINNVTGDTEVLFTHDTNFTDISGATDIRSLNAVQVKMYPNPASSFVHIEVTEDLQSTLKVYDLSGTKRSLNIYKQNGLFKLDLSELNSGIYFIEVEGNNSRQTLKLNKQ